MSMEVDTIDRAENGDVEYFRKAPLRDIQTAVSKEHGFSSFNVAVIHNKLECCKMIYSRCPSLLYHCNRHGSTAMLHAAYYGSTAMIIEFLIWANDQKDYVGEETDVESGLRRQQIKNLNLLTLPDCVGNIPLHNAVYSGSVETVKMLIEADHGRDSLKMLNLAKETPLHMAVKKGNIEMVTALIEADHGRDSLKMVNNKKETPLHLAVRKGKIEMVTALMEANPDFEYGVDKSGDTPLSLAIKAKSGLIIRLLLKKQPDKIKLRINDKGWTLIHYAVNEGDLNLMNDIIEILPISMEVVDNEDIYGHTPLHVAALTGNEAIIRCLLYDKRVDKMTTNNQGQHVLDTITCDYDRAKAGIFGPTGRMTQNEWKNQSDFDLVVGALIAAVSFTAGITVPGGYISDGPNQGRAVLSKQIPFIAFAVSNNFALMFSLYAVFSHFCTRRLQREEDISHLLKVAQYCTLGAIFAMMVAFIAGSYTVLANCKPLAITGLVSCCCFFGFASRPLCRMGMQHSVQTRIQMCWKYMSRCWEKQEIIQDNQIPEVITEGGKTPEPDPQEGRDATIHEARRLMSWRYMCHCCGKQEIIKDKQEITEYQNSNQMDITTA